MIAACVKVTVCGAAVAVLIAVLTWVIVTGSVKVDIEVVPGSEMLTNCVNVEAEGVTVTGNVRVCVTFCGRVSVCTSVEVMV